MCLCNNKARMQQLLAERKPDDYIIGWKRLTRDCCGNIVTPYQGTYVDLSTQMFKATGKMQRRYGNCTLVHAGIHFYTDKKVARQRSTDAFNETIVKVYAKVSDILGVGNGYLCDMAAKEIIIDYRDLQRLKRIAGHTI